MDETNHSVDWLDRAARLTAAKHLELDLKGYPPRMVEGAIDRAWGRAAAIAKMLSADLQAPAVCQILENELETAEAWIEGINRKVFGDGESEQPPTERPPDS